MKDRRITVNFDEEDEWIEELVESGQCDSKSAAVRAMARRGYRDVPRFQERIDDLEEDLDRRDERIEELTEQLRRRSQIEEKIEDLPQKLDEEPAPPFFVRWVQWWRERD